MNRKSEFWSTRLCCAAMIAVLSVGFACAQSDLPFPEAGSREYRGAAAETQAPATGSVTNAHFQMPAANAAASPAAASLELTTAARGESGQPARRTATPLAPRSTPRSSDPNDESSGGNGGSAFGSILIALGFVIVLMLGVAKVIQRRNPFAVTGVPREAVDVLGRRTVDPRNSIYLVRVGPKILLLGNSANGLTPLSEITDPIEVASLANICRATTERPPADLFTFFKGLLNRRSSTSEISSFEDRFGERLTADAQQGESGTVTSVSVAPRQEARRV